MPEEALCLPPFLSSLRADKPHFGLGHLSCVPGTVAEAPAF